MKLPSFPFAKKPKSDYFLTLVLQDEKIGSLIFEKIAQKITVLGKAEEYLDSSIDEISFEELLDYCDKVVSQAEEQTSKDLGILKTIFGLKQSWIVDSKIKKDYIDRLQKVSKELELQPVGFLTISDAIVNIIQKDEGAPVSGILADIGKKFVTVTLIKAGKIIESKTSEIHQSPVFTVDTLLKHLTLPEILPSKVFFIGEEELTQEFIGHQWSKSLPFLHLPQIINLSESFIERAFILGVAKEMRAEITSEEVSGEVAKESEETKETEPEQIESLKESAEEKPKLEHIEDAQSFFGFVEGKDVAKEEPKTFTEPEAPIDVTSKAVEEIPQEVKIQTGNKILPIIIPIVASARNKLVGLLSKIRLPQNLKGNRKIILPGGIAALFLLLLIFYFFGLKANIALSIKPQIEELSEKVLFSANKSSDFKKNVIASESISASLEGSVSKATTGKKEVGDKAKGTVTIFNNNDNPVTLAQGAAITSSNQLKFTLDTSTNVASQSGDAFSGTKPGTATVKVTASDIGTEYNLPSQTRFSVSGSVTVVAKNDNPFSGGTKKEIPAVSEEDLLELEEVLIDKFKEEARIQILNKTEGGKQILPEFLKTDVLKPDFDKEVEDEASKVSLKGTATFQALVFKRNDILDYSEQSLIPGNLAINRENIKINFKDIKSINDKEMEAQLNIEARILPKIEKDKIIPKILGKSFEEAEKYLLTLPNIINVRISHSPNIFFLPKTLPRNSKNININLQLD